MTKTTSMILILCLLIVVMAFDARAENNFASAHRFNCGDADVRIEVIHRESAIQALIAEALVQVRTDGVQTVLRYWGGVDYIGGTCAQDASGNPKVVYQAYCGGTGCYDLDNWGIVDPANLRVLLVPTNDNKGRAKAILGAELPAIKDLIPVRVNPGA